MPAIIPTSEQPLGGGGAPQLAPPGTIDPNIFGATTFVANVDRRIRERRDAEKAARLRQAAEQGVIQQTRGSGQGVVLPDPTGGPEEQMAFEEAARKVQGVQLKTEATATRAELLAANPTDPAAFGAAFSDYTKQTVDAIRRTDPLAAATSELMLQELAATGRQTVATAQALRVKAEQQEAFSQSVNDIALNTSSIIAAGGSEEDMLEGLSDLGSALRLGYEGADGSPRYLTTPQKAGRALTTAQNSIADAFVQRNLLDAEATGDAGGLLAAAVKLENGAWYVDPAKGLAKARELRRAAKKIQNAARAEGTFAGDMLANMVSAASKGLPADMEQAERLNADVQARGTARQRFNATLNMNGLRTLAAVTPAIESASTEQLVQIQDQLGAGALMTADVAVSAAAGGVKKELDRRQKAGQTGNPYAGMPALDPLAAPPAEFEARRKLAEAAGNPVGVLLAPGEAETAAKGIEARLIAGDAPGALEGMNRLVVLAGSPMQASRMVADSAKVSGVTAIALALSAAGMTTETQAFLAAAGAGYSAGEVSFSDPLASLGEVNRMLNGVSQGDSTTVGAARQALELARKGAYSAALARRADDDDAKAEADAAVKQLVFAFNEDLVDLSNGRSVPRFSLAGPDVFFDGALSPVRVAVDELLTRPEAFGLDPRDGDLLERLVPRMTPQGTLMFWDTLTQTWVTGVEVDTRDMARKAQAEEIADADAGGFLNDLADAWNHIAATDTDTLALQDEMVLAKKTGADPQLLQAVRRVTKKTAPSEKLGVGDYNVLSSAAKNVKPKKFPAELGTGLPAVAAALLAGYTAAYETPREALYAYALGPGVLAALQASGPDWEKRVPLSAQRFVKRVELELEPDDD